MSIKLKSFPIGQFLKRHRETRTTYRTEVGHQIFVWKNRCYHEKDRHVNGGKWWNDFGRTDGAVTEGNQRVGFYSTFSIDTELRSVMDNKANGHRSTPVRSLINTCTVIWQLSVWLPDVMKFTMEVPYIHCTGYTHSLYQHTYIRTYTVQDTHIHCTNTRTYIHCTGHTRVRTVPASQLVFASLSS